MQSLAPTESRFFTALDAAEVRVVTRVAAAAERLRLAPVARVTTRLGNGWLYPILSAVLMFAAIERPLRFLLSAAVSLVFAFALYPLLKSAIGRARPCDYAPSLLQSVSPLDEYSCPSGHAMTAAAYAVTMVFAWPAAMPLALALCAVMGWSRVAMGHHYVSDVVAGTLLGISIAVPVALVVF